jgi:hypothetical protein
MVASDLVLQQAGKSFIVPEPPRTAAQASSIIKMKPVSAAPFPNIAMTAPTNRIYAKTSPAVVIWVSQILEHQTNAGGVEGALTQRMHTAS